MKQIIRWKYVLPRVLIIGGLIALIWFGRNWFLKHLLITAGQKLLGAKLEIGSLQSSPLSTEIRIDQLVAAHPRKPYTNLFSADRIQLKMDPKALWAGRYVVREARIEGIRVGTSRGDPGQLEEDDLWFWLPPFDGEELAEALLKPLGNFVESRIQQELDALESPGLMKELLARWPAHYAELRERAESLKNRVGHLKSLAKAFEESTKKPNRNPAEILANWQHLIDELGATYSELQWVRQRLEQLPGEVRYDVNRVLAAKDRDLAHIQQRVQRFAEHPERLAEFLVGPEVAELLVQLKQWVLWVREYLPYLALPSPERSRGIDIVPVRISREPKWAIELARLQGEAKLGDYFFRYSGEMTGLCSEPELANKPLELELAIAGPVQLQATAVRRFSGPQTEDEITVSCGDWAVRERTFGKPEKFALTLSGGRGHVWVRVRRSSQGTFGEILWQQTPVKLALSWPRANERAWIAESLRHALANISELRVAARWQREGDELDWKLESNLEPQLASAFEAVARSALEQQRMELIQALEKRLAKQLSEFEVILTLAQREILTRLDFGEQGLAELRPLLARGPAGGLPILPRGRESLSPFLEAAAAAGLPLLEKSVPVPGGLPLPFPTPPNSLATPEEKRRF